MLADWAAKADGVLIDAPCSGTGTWRRNPEARWRLTPERLARLGAMQTQVLDIGLVWSSRAGGWSISSVRCSMPKGAGR